MTNIIPFISKDDLKKEIENLRKEIARVVVQKDELLCIECKNIEAAYFVEFGGLETQLYQSEITWRRLRRKLELMVLARNHQVQPNMEAIEKQLDKEFLDYQKGLDDILDKISNALERFGLEKLTNEEAIELKTLYRKIVKKLHPDLNAHLSEQEKMLFFRAVSAYESGDLVTLRIIAETIEKKDDLNVKASLPNEKQRLEIILHQIEEDIVSIKNSYPYLFKNILNNEKTKTQHRDFLKEQLLFNEERIVRYEREISCFI